MAFERLDENKGPWWPRFKTIAGWDYDGPMTTRECLSTMFGPMVSVFRRHAGKVLNMFK